MPRLQTSFVRSGLIKLPSSPVLGSFSSFFHSLPRRITCSHFPTTHHFRSINLAPALGTDSLSQSKSLRTLLRSPLRGSEPTRPFFFSPSFSQNQVHLVRLDSNLPIRAPISQAELLPSPGSHDETGDPRSRGRGSDFAFEGGEDLSLRVEQVVDSFRFFLGLG